MHALIVCACHLKFRDYKKKPKEDNLFHLCSNRQQGHTVETMLAASLNLLKATLNLCNILIPCKLEWNLMD